LAFLRLFFLGAVSAAAAALRFIVWSSLSEDAARPSELCEGCEGGGDASEARELSLPLASGA
jgi:hypothetical protein